jgi:hypothetical protein
LAKKKQSKPSNVVQLKDYTRRADEPVIDLVQVLKKVCLAGNSTAIWITLGSNKYFLLSEDKPSACWI